MPTLADIIGEFLEQAIENVIEKSSIIDDKVSEEVKSAIENFTDDYSPEVDQISGLEREIENQIERWEERRLDDMVEIIIERWVETNLKDKVEEILESRLNSMINNALRRGFNILANMPEVGAPLPAIPVAQLIPEPTGSVASVQAQTPVESPTPTITPPSVEQARQELLRAVRTL